MLFVMALKAQRTRPLKASAAQFKHAQQALYGLEGER